MSAIGNPVPAPSHTPQAPAPGPGPSVQKERPRRLRLLILIAVVAVGGLAVWLALSRSRTPAAPVAVVRTVKVTSGVLERKVRVSGQTSARNYANIVAPLLRGPESRNSLILLKLVSSGTPVKKGDLLCQIDGQTAQDHIEDTRDTVQQSENDVKKRVAEQDVEYKALEQTARVAKGNYDKAKWENQAAEVWTPIDQEKLRLAVEEYEANYKAALKDLEVKKAAHKAEMRILEITFLRQRRHLDRHVTDIQKYTIKSPMNGLAVAQQIWRGGDMATITEGDQVYPGQPILKVVDLSSMQVEGTVNQAESEDFRIGQPAKVTLDAFPGLEFKGRVYSIGALAVGGRMQNYYIRNIPVRVAIEGLDPRLIPDLSASADVVIGSSEPNSALVPLSAVREEGKKSYVYVKKGQTFERREVELGFRSGVQAVALAGVSVGDELRID